MATHPSFLAWKIPMDRGAWWATVHGVRVGHDCAGMPHTLLVKPELCCGSGSQQVSRDQSVASTISFSELSFQKYPGIFLPRSGSGLDLPRKSWAHISALTQPPIVRLDLSPSGGISSCPRIP